MNKTTYPQITFAVDPVETGRRLLPTEKAHASVETLLGTRIEACDNYRLDVVKQPGFHSLVAAAHLAYQHHFPLLLSPDAIWLTLAQGLANHINNNAEELRSHFVTHQGKVKITVRRDDFVKGSPENPWTEVWPEFSAEIRKVIGPEAHSLILSDFSTTGATEKAASEVVLMDCVQSYFSYEVMTLCGIPQITLEGTVEDWEKIHHRVERLAQYDLKWWTDDVLQITSEFVAAAKGNPNRSFWHAIYKQKDESGGPYTQGWLARLIPYLKREEGRPADFKNPLLGRRLVGSQGMAGITDDQLPSSASQVPFVWKYYENNYDYQFVAGLLTVEQDKINRAVRPRVGWAVREVSQAKKRSTSSYAEEESSVGDTTGWLRRLVQRVLGG